MKSNVRIFIATFAAGAILCLSQGCIKDHFPQMESGGGSVPVLMSVGTRADIQDEEVVSLRVYAFSGGALVGEYHTDSPNFVAGKATLIMDLRQVAASPQRTTFFVIANEASAAGLSDASGVSASFASARGQRSLQFFGGLREKPAEDGLGSGGIFNAGDSNLTVVARASGEEKLHFADSPRKGQVDFLGRHLVAFVAGCAVRGRGVQINVDRLHPGHRDAASYPSEPQAFEIVLGRCGRK